MKTVQDVFDAAMGFMDELSATGEAQSSDTKEYEYRTPGIVNMMVSEYRMLSGQAGGFVAVEGLPDYILKIDDTYAVLPLLSSSSVSSAKPVWTGPSSSTVTVSLP